MLLIKPQCYKFIGDEFASEFSALLCNTELEDKKL